MFNFSLSFGTASHCRMTRVGFLPHGRQKVTETTETYFSRNGQVAGTANHVHDHYDLSMYDKSYIDSVNLLTGYYVLTNINRRG